MLAFICLNTSRWIWEQQTCVILLRHWPGTCICGSGSSCVYFLCPKCLLCFYVYMFWEQYVCMALLQPWPLTCFCTYYSVLCKLDHHLLLYITGTPSIALYHWIINSPSVQINYSVTSISSLQIGSPSAIAFKVFISGFQMLSTFISTFSIQINPCKKGKNQGFTDIKLFVDLYLPIYISWAHEHELVFHLRVTTR